MTSPLSLPSYIVERVRRPIPVGSAVVVGSTPVVAFGNARAARVATLGLNPSRVEFLDRHGRELPEAQRRLETLSSLGVAQLEDAPEHLVARVVANCDRYFHRNPYWRWFRPLDRILGGLGASYAAGTACHLDLVQWATDPVWGKLSPQVRAAFVTADAPFLSEQLNHEQIAVLLLNGKSVVDTFSATFGVSLRLVGRVEDRSVSSALLVGEAFRGITVLGWSTNLQSSFGVTREFGKRLAFAVAQWVPHLQRAGS